MQFLSWTNSRQSLPIWLAVAVLVGCGLVGSLKAQPPTVSGYQLNWRDEFVGNSLNTSLWQASFSTNPTNNSLHAYLPSQVTVDGGNLVITSENIPFGGLPYRSGLVTSRQEQKFGRWEVRAKLPATTGMWPAIWLLADVNQNPWPSGGEIDIMENRGDEPNMTSSAFHYGTNPPFQHDYTSREYRSVTAGQTDNFHDSFHTYAAEWDPDQIRFYVDDVHYSTVFSEDVGGFIGNDTAPMNLVINTAVGGTFLNNPDSSTVWPQQFLIDHVYVYDRLAEGKTLTFENGGFDADGGSLQQWTTFGNRLPNVQSHVEAVRDGVGSLKLFGQFRNPGAVSGVEQGISVTGGESLRVLSESFIRSADSIAGTDNEVLMKIDYYSATHARFDSAQYLSSDSIQIASSTSPNDQWQQHQLTATVPAGAVEARVAFVFSQPNENHAGAVHIDNVLFGRPGDYGLIWDENGDGDWATNRWIGPLDRPQSFDNATIRSDRVRVVSGQAHDVTVESGILNIVGSLQAHSVSVHDGAAITNRGLLSAELNLAGTLLIEGIQSLTVQQAIAIGASAKIDLGDNFRPARGTLTGDILLLSGNSLSGQFANPSGIGTESHLGDGVFLRNLIHSPTSVVANIYSALEGDANGDGFVDTSDYNIWNANKFSTGDWTSGDFNSDGVVDTADFNIWNSHRFQSVNLSAVPEPSVDWMFALPMAAGFWDWLRRQSVKSHAR